MGAKHSAKKKKIKFDKFKGYYFRMISNFNDFFILISRNLTEFFRKLQILSRCAENSKLRICKIISGSFIESNFLDVSGTSESFHFFIFSFVPIFSLSVRAFRPE